MSHPIDMESSNSGEQSNPQFRGPNRLESAFADLYKAIKEGNKKDFASKFKQLCGKQKPSFSDSEVMDHVSCAGDTLLHVAVKYGKHDIAQFIADDYPGLIRKANVKGDTPLHVAARSKDSSEDSSMVKVILEAYAKAKPSSKEADALCRMTNEFGNTPLHEAVVKNNFAGAQMLYNANKLMAHYLNKEDKSPLYVAVEVAVESGNREIVDLLLQAPTENREEIKKGKSPLLAAILRVNQGERKKCIDCGPMVEGWLKHLPRLPCIPKTQSSTEDSLNILDRILKARPELMHMKDETGGTPLHRAALLGHLNGVRKLLEEDPASALEWNTKGYLPIHLASKKGHVSVVEEILKKIAWFDPIDLINRKGQNILHMAAKNGKHEVVKYILGENKLKKLLNEKDKDGNTPLHSASKFLHPNILFCLTQVKAVHVNLVNNLGMTARDVVLQQKDEQLRFRKLLSSEILFLAGTPLSEKGERFECEGQSTRLKFDLIKEHTSTLMLVTTLVATVTFAAGFTVPGGLKDSNNDMETIGIAALMNRCMFKVFIVCDVVAMYSSISAALILLWTELSDFNMAIRATHFTLILVAVALVTMSTAFMAAVHLIVRNLSWLTRFVIIMSIIFPYMFSVGFGILMFAIGVPLPLLSPASLMMIIPSKSYSKVKWRKDSREQIQTDPGTNKG